MIGKAVPFPREQTDYTAGLDQRGEKNTINDTNTDGGKTKHKKWKFKVNDEWQELLNDSL